MAKQEAPSRRKKVLIDREFQLGFIWRLGGVLFFYLLVFLMVSVVAPVGFTLAGSEAEWAMMEVAYRVQVLLNLVLAPMVCTFLCLFVHGVLETFRIAGPNYRFKAVFGDLSRGRLPRGVQIRANDYLQDTARDLNEALISVHDRVAGWREQSAAALAEVRESGSTSALEELCDQLAQIDLVGQAPACKPLDPARSVEEPQDVIAEPKAVEPEPVASGAPDA